VLSFSKYSGAGNDFLVIDNRDGLFPLDAVPGLCDRFDGIGADGVLLLQNSTRADYRMRIINADGSEAAQCGNGLRCFMRYLSMEIDGRMALTVETGGGLVSLELRGDKVAATMPAAQVHQWDLELKVDGRPYLFHSLSVGVPHAVHFGQPQDIAAQDLVTLGRSVRHHQHFAPQGTNVNFAWLNEAGEVELRTYERGVEGLTQACGTGAVATALAATRVYGLKGPIILRTARRDTLQVAPRAEGVELVGPARFVFKGTCPLS
jgi:diaminopimelate epimerase